MQILLKQSDIETAIKEHIHRMGVTMPINEINFTAGRGAGGLTAEIDVGEVTDQPKTVNTVREAAPEKTVKAAEPVKAATQVAPAPENNDAEPAGEGQDDEPPFVPDAKAANEVSEPAEKKSLFS